MKAVIEMIMDIVLLPLDILLAIFGLKRNGGE